MVVTKSKAKYQYNAEPRLSANQLAEYLTASPTRRKSIIKDARFPRTIVVARYDVARTAIAGFLADPMRKVSILTDAIDDLLIRETKETASTWMQGDSRLSSEAIKAFHATQGQLGLGKMDFRRITKKKPKLLIRGVEISVSLDVTTHRPNKGAPDSVGGLVLVLSKSEQSIKARLERCKTIAVLAAMFAADHLDYLGSGPINFLADHTIP